MAVDSVCQFDGGSSRSRRPMPFGCMAATRSGRMWCSGCSTTPASNEPAGMRKTGAGRHTKRRSPLQIDDPLLSRRYVRMAPKYHPTPLSGSGRKALTKELGKARAMAMILATRSAEMRAKGEAVIQQADKLLCESWNERIWSDGEPDRSVAYDRPGRERRLSLARDHVRTLQDTE